MANINYYPGHMAKTKRLIKERIKYIDIVFELVDARAPFSTMNPDLKTMIGNTPKLMLLNKADLADAKELSRFEQFFKENGVHSLRINALSGDNVNKIQATATDILKEVFDKERSKGLRPRALRALIVGIPNVGKSTLINRLVNKKATKVGDTPGITRHLQMIRINKNFELLDTPGILWPKLDVDVIALNLALLGTIKDSLVPRDEVVIHGVKLLREYYPKTFAERYDMTITETDTTLDLLDKIGQRLGCLDKGGSINYERVMDHFLYDFRHERFGSIVLETVESKHVQP